MQKSAPSIIARYVRNVRPGFNCYESLIDNSELSPDRDFKRLRDAVNVLYTHKLRGRNARNWRIYWRRFGFWMRSSHD